MSFENVKNFWQIIIYIATAITISGSFLIDAFPNLKVKWLFNFKMGLCVSTFGGIIFLLAAIFFNIYSNKVESEKQLTFQKQLAQRDKIIKENNESLILTNRFHAEVDNPIKSIFIIFDLGSVTLSNNFDDFYCIIRFPGLDITGQFQSVKFDNPLSENTQNMEARFVKGKDLESSPLTMIKIGSFKTISEFYLDLFLFTKLLPKDFKIRDLNGVNFYLYLSEKQTGLVKGIKINVNNWDVFNKREQKIHWRELKQDWLPHGENLRVFYQEYQTRFYDYNTIQFFQEGFNYYEIVHSNIDHRSILKKVSISNLFKNINVNKGTLVFEIDNKWRILNNALIEYIPVTSKNGVKIRVFRDSDNLLKVYFSYKYGKDLILRCKYPENFSDSKDYHNIIITWGADKVVFYIDGKEVDEIIVQE